MRLFLLFLFLLISQISEANTYTVITGGDDGYQLRYYINIASPGDTIYISNVLAGITLTTSEIVIDKPLSIIGAFTTQFIERSNASGTPAFRILRFVNSGNVYIKNIEIKGGVSPIVNNKASNGGGIVISDTNCRVILENCKIYANHAANGLIISLPNYTPQFNGGKGGGISNGGNLLLINCLIESNKAGDGGRAHYFKDEPLGEWQCFDGGSGGGIVNFYKLSLISCTLSSNKAGNGGVFYNPIMPYERCLGYAGNGGAIFNAKDITIINSLFYSNSPGRSEIPGVNGYNGNGGSMYNINNCTIINTTISSDSYYAPIIPNGGPDSTTTLLPCVSVLDEGNQMTITNSIIYNPSSGQVPEIYAFIPERIFAYNSLIRKISWPILQGEHNMLDVNPMFIPGGYQLSFNSPCINNGKPGTTGLPALDLDNKARIVEGIVDMGAFEYQGFTGNTKEKDIEVSVFPNPSNGKFNILFNEVNSSKSFSLSIVDITGRPVYNKDSEQFVSPFQIDLDKKVSAGIYLLIIQTEKGIHTQKLIINTE